MSLRLSERLDPAESTNEEHGLLLDTLNSQDDEHMIDLEEGKVSIEQSSVLDERLVNDALGPTWNKRHSTSAENVGFGSDSQHAKSVPLEKMKPKSTYGD